MKGIQNLNPSIAFPSISTRFSCLDQLRTTVEKQICAEKMEHSLRNALKPNNCTDVLESIQYKTSLDCNPISICKNVEEPKEVTKIQSLSHLDCSSNNKKYLIINPRGGLGNRLGSIASAYAVARVTGRTLVLDWSINTPEKGYEVEMPAPFNDLFDNPIISLDEFISDHDSLLSNDTKKELLIRFKKLKRTWS
ncbi:MAG TPA: hypothetical protein VGP47_09330, partial [Parachlamydiaceae bacterium]|nr:hypothetical protein [Parachlamydiaceae bacterium]